MDNDLEIGQVGEINGVKVECIEVEYYIRGLCQKCAFHRSDDKECNIPCINFERADNKHVYFKKVE